MWIVVVVLGIVIIVCIKIIADALSGPPAPPPPPPPPPAPPLPPPPPPPVSILSSPGRFALRFVNPPTSIAGRGTFRLQIVPVGIWNPGEVPSYTGGKVTVKVMDGSEQGTVSFIREIGPIDPAGNPTAIDLSEASVSIGPGGTLSVVVVSGGVAGADQLWAQIPGSPNFPVTADYEITPN